MVMTPEVRAAFEGVMNATDNSNEKLRIQEAYDYFSRNQKPPTNHDDDKEKFFYLSRGDKKCS